MVLRIELPAEISEALEHSLGDMSTRVLRSLAIDGYRAGALSEYQVGQMLGLDRNETNDFLFEARCSYNYGEAEFIRDAEVADKLAEGFRRESADR